MKRSRHVALFGIGVSALMLSACEDPNEVVPVKAYDSVATCLADGNDRATCGAALAEAENAYDSAYPKYDAKGDCEANAGADKCELDYPNSRDGSWRPLMTGFLLGMAASSRTPAQPLVANAASPTGRATVSGYPITSRSVNAVVPRQVASAPAASQVAKGHTQARGGFGSTASRVASSGSAGTASAGG